MIKDDLKKSEPIAYQSLLNGLKNNKVAHSYLFSGEYNPLKIEAAYLLAQSIIENNNDFLDVIKHPQIGTKQKKKTFINIFKGNIDEELLSFLLILIEKDRILFLKEKLKEMEKIHLDKLNVLQGIVKTTVALEEYEYNSLVDKLEKKYNKEIILKKEIDPEIIGGIYVRIGNDVIDGTLKTRLDELRKLALSME